MIEFGLQNDSVPDCNGAEIFRKAWEKFCSADFKHDIANRVSNFDTQAAEKVRNLAHDILVCRRNNESRHLAVELRCIGVKCTGCIVAVVNDDLAARPCEADGLAQESSRICNVADNGVRQHQIELSMMGAAALAVRLKIFNVFQSEICCDVLCNFNQLS